MRLAIRMHPGADRTRIRVTSDDHLDVWVSARAMDGKANAAVRQLVAQHLRLRLKQVRSIAGLRGRAKTVEVDLVDGTDLRPLVVD